MTFKPPFFIGEQIPTATAHLVDGLKFSGILAIGYALYCLLLPRTPPEKSAGEKMAFLKAFRLLKKRSVRVLFLTSIPISTVHRIFYMQNPPFLSAIGMRDADIMPTMSVGQIGEIVVILILGFLLLKLGYKWVIFTGAMANCLRYLIFSMVFLPIPVIVTTQLLHGLCFGCFYLGGAMYVDKVADKDIRHSAQVLFGLTAMGCGPILGGLLSGFLDRTFCPMGATDKFIGIWLTLSAIAFVSSLLFVIFFRPQHTE